MIEKLGNQVLNWTLKEVKHSIPKEKFVTLELRRFNSKFDKILPPRFWVISVYEDFVDRIDTDDL